jgi:DinB superfamily
MSDAMTKAKLLAKMHATRREWDVLLAHMSPAQMMQPSMIGDWSIKDVIFHCTSYARWFVTALQAVVLGTPLPAPENTLPIDERNQLDFRESQQHSLDSVLADARDVFCGLIELTEAQTEALLLEPQRFAGIAEPILVWKHLDYVCNHYRGHMQAIRAGLEQSLAYS